MADELIPDSASLQDVLAQADYITSVPKYTGLPRRASNPTSLPSEGSTAGGETLIDWDGPDDPANPKNWSTKKKWAATVAVSAFAFMAPLASSMVAPAAGQVSEEFGITSTIVESMVFSVFVLGFAVGPLFLGPLSEIYGRTIVIQASNIFFLVWNLACGFAQNQNQLIAFRLLAGIGGSAPLVIGGAVLNDMFAAEDRGKAIAIYSLAPLLGPAVGPIAGAWIAESSTWRWVFRSTTIADAFIQIAGLFFLRETYAPVLLARKAGKMSKAADAEKANIQPLRTVYQLVEVSWKERISKALFRPFVMLWQEPILQVFSLYLAYLYGMIYLVIGSMTNIYLHNYHESVGISGLHYIALGIGFWGASQVNARALDKIYVYLRNRNGGVGIPEYRLPPMIPGTLFLPIGLLLFGWGATYHLPWIVLDIGLVFIGAGIILPFQCCQSYLIDTFGMWSASALAVVSCLRSLAGFGFPLFAPAMYKALGYGKADTILAALSIAIGCPAPWVFWYYGERIRGASKRATTGKPVEKSQIAPEAPVSKPASQ
ncbi:MFS polyamine transporter [Athelia psychrophila]|uniref:MFS polyamine transporter n=1 Tax=Athelia psychrophila TaxID=1759441 RepID=A0A166NWQ8_9AGAM|nr:MFS polyamine transporter [Fibularhizoctonia sp. CBS 109695]